MEDGGGGGARAKLRREGTREAVPRELQLDDAAAADATGRARDAAPGARRHSRPLAAVRPPAPSVLGSASLSLSLALTGAWW